MINTRQAVTISDLVFVICWSARERIILELCTSDDRLFIRRQLHVWSNPLPPAHPPAVRAHAGGDHDVRIFDTLPEGQLVDETHSPPPRPPCKKAVPSYKGLAGLQVRGGWFPRGLASVPCWFVPPCLPSMASGSFVRRAAGFVATRASRRRRR